METTTFKEQIDAIKFARMFVDSRSAIAEALMDASNTIEQLDTATAKSLSAYKKELREKVKVLIEAHRDKHWELTKDCDHWNQLNIISEGILSLLKD